MKRTLASRAAAPAAVLLALSLSACGAANEQQGGGGGDNTGGAQVSGTLSGAGASSQAAAVEAWKAGFEGANPQATINYDPVGSGGGRTQFLSGGVHFAGSDAYLDQQELARVPQACRGGELIELPLYISPIAIAYKVSGVNDLQLSPAVLAGIFDGEIRRWNDPKIAADNPGVTLPATAITAVHRSDESGTTENFTEYLAATAPRAWPHEPSGSWPIAGGEAAKGTTGVVQAISSGEGTIGYSDASQIGDLPAAKVKVGDAYVPPSDEAAAKIVDESERVPNRGQFDYAIDLKRDTTSEGTYPIVLVSYTLACTRYQDQQTADLAKAWVSYLASQEGQQAANQAAGSAPISDTTRQNAQQAAQAITAAG